MLSVNSGSYVVLLRNQGSRVYCERSRVKVRVIRFFGEQGACCLDTGVFYMFFSCLLMW